MEETFTTLETLQGSFTLVFVLISFALGLTIMLKYFKFKRPELLLVGFCWMGLVSPYWPDAITFISVLTTGEWLADAPYFLIANVLIAPLHICWMIVMTEFLWKDKQKPIMIIVIIEALFFEIFFITHWSIDPANIGMRQSAFVVLWAVFIDLYLLASIMLFLITGFLFAHQSLKADNPEINLKGKFLILAIIFFVCGTILDVVVDVPNEVIIVLARILLIISSFSFYIGFVMPNWVKKRLIK